MNIQEILRSKTFGTVVIGGLVLVAIFGQPNKEKSCRTTQESYERLTTGMSIERSTDVVGCPVKQHSQQQYGNQKIDYYYWNLDKGGMITVIFQNGALVGKLAD